MTTEERKEKIAGLRKHHEATFRAWGVPKAYFCAKTAHIPHGRDGKVIGLFSSELSHGDPVYIEFVDMDYNIVDASRMLYKFPYTPDFATKYEIKKNQYLIPVEELKVVGCGVDISNPTSLYVKRDVNEASITWRCRRTGA